MIIFDHSLLENLSLGIYKVTFTFIPPLWLLLYVLVLGVPLSWSDPLETVFHRTVLIPFSYSTVLSLASLTRLIPAYQQHNDDSAPNS